MEAGSFLVLVSKYKRLLFATNFLQGQHPATLWPYTQGQLMFNDITSVMLKLNFAYFSHL